MEQILSENIDQSPDLGLNEVYTFPLSVAQRDMWLASQMAASSAAYHITDNFVLRGPLRIDLLARSLNEIVARHETLRTTFAAVDGELLQIVAPELKYELPFIDLEPLAAEDRDFEMRRLTKLHACAPFDLAKGPLVRWRLLRLEPERHLLLCTMHHMITDGWSESILQRELISLYDAFSRGEEPSLPELTIQYADFAVWERECLQGERLDSLLDYWKKQLTGLPEALTLPADHAPGEHSAFKWGLERFSLPQEATRRLFQISRSAGVSIYVTLVTAFAVLLHRLGGQDELLIGSPVANRNRVELENLIGLFLNILVLRFDLSGNPAFRDLLPRVRETAYGAQEHQGLPLETLVSALREMGQSPPRPFFRVLFNLENTPQERTSQVAGITFERYAGGTDTAKTDLIWNVVETGSGLTGSFEYNADLFEAGTVARIGAELTTLLDGIASNPDTPIEDLPIIPESERLRILAHDSARAIEPSLQVDVRESFETQVNVTPDAVAVIDTNWSSTFAELNRRANQLADYLIDRGVRRESLVAIPMQCCPEFVVAVLAVLKAGGAYVPIDVTAPAERIRYLLKDAGVELAITCSRWRPRLPEGTAQTICLDEFEAELSERSTANPSVPASPESLAYVIYTSGSTGRPKGVMVHHRALASYLRWCAMSYPVAEGEGAPLHGSLASDMSVTSLFAPLLAGRAITLLSETSGIEDLAATLSRERRFSFVKLTPSHLLLLNALLPNESASSAISLIVGGEALSFEHLSYWRRYAPEIQIINEYGPTEAVVGCCTYQVNLSDPQTGSVSIGRSISGTRLYVLDSSMRLVPIGAAGELYIGGAQVTRGYLERPAATAERFIPDPFGQDPGARLYRTGDLVRYRSDLTLDYLGRADDQLKIRGFRVEPGEVEAALLEHPSIGQAAVVGREDEPGQTRLVAYVVLKHEVPLSEIHSFLSRKLPEPMLPSAIVPMEALKLTESGKVDRKALPAPIASRSASDRVFVEPRNSVEEILASIWSKALNLQRVGVHDNFYSLGGDSIRSLRVVALAKARGLPLSIQQMARYRTIAELAPQIRTGEKQLEEEVHTSPFSLVSPDDRAKLPEDVEDAYPLAHMQLGMLFHTEMTPNAPLFHSINSFYLRLPLDAEKIRRAVSYVAARHANLRTSFDLSSYSEPLQLVHRNPGFPLEIFDLRHLTEDEQECELKRFWEEESKRPFELSCAPHLRFHIHRRTDDTFVYTLTENHAIVDGWSLHLMWDEILVAYFALLDGQEPDLPPLKTTYRDFIASERKALQSPQAEAFWDAKLRGYTVAKLPRLPGHSPDLEQLRVKRIDTLLPRSLIRDLRKLAREESVPLKSIFLAAHFKVISALTASRDVVTGLSCNGRLEAEDGERVCGLFLNTLPVRIELSGGTWKELFKRACDEEMELLPVRRYPLSAIQAKWGVEPLFNTSFVYLNFHVIGDRLRSSNIVLKTGSFVEETNFGIMTGFLHMPGRAARVALSLCADRWLFTEQQITEINAYYLKALAAMVADPSARYDTFSPLSDSELSQIIAQGSGETEELTDEPTVLRQFAEHASRLPEQPCLSYEQLTLSYGDVDRRSNQLANYLRDLGVGFESRVAIGIDRTPELVIALLGVLKAGACYVPVDSTLPSQRLEFMLKDANASMVLTLDRLRESFVGCDASVLALDSDWPRLALSSQSSPDIDVDPRHLAYIIYTSGTTGRPKGVAIEHRQLANYTAAAIQRLDLPMRGKYGLISTFAADLGNTMIFPALSTGSCLRVFSDREATDPALLAEQLAHSPIDCLKIVPSHLSALLSHTEPEAVLPRATLVLGGEAAEARLIERLEAIAPQLKVFNHYGPTETTVGALAGKVVNDGWGGAKKPTLGRPLRNTQVYVLDSNMQIVPVGAAGELYIGGAGVSRGYWNSPAQTAERFGPDPFSEQPGTRLYRTGDLVRWLPGDNLEFIGRVDNQVKLHGYRIELQEVEAAMLEHPGVARAVALVRDLLGGPHLAAYVVAAGKDPVDERDLRTYLRGKLPGHAVPDIIAVVPAFPLTANGKVDRDALARLELDLPNEDTYAAPSTPIEIEMTRIWQDVLQVERIGVHDSFFDLGGNSIKAILLTARVRKAFEAHVSVASVFTTGTISGLAHVVGSALQAQSRQGEPIRPMARDHKPPLSFVQKRFWYAYHLAPETAAQNLPLALRLRGPLEVAALKRGLDEVVRRHEVLRASFPFVDGEPMQVIEQHRPTELSVKDLGGLPEDRREVEMRSAARAEAWSPFDVERGPLMRALLIRVGPQDHALVLTFHHIVFDGWSAEILLRELAQLYSAFLKGETPGLPEPALQYADFADWERAWLTAEVEASQIAYWKERLSGVRPLELPTDRARPAIQTYSGGAVHVRFTEELTAALQQLSQKEGVTFFMLVLAGYAAVLQHRSKRGDIVIGCPIASYRDRSELQDVIGPFLNTLAMRIDLEGDPTFRQVLGRARRTAVDAYARQEAPFERVVEALGTKRDASRSPIFQVWFNHSDIGSSAVSFDGLKVEGVDVGDRLTKFDLMLSTEMAGGRLNATLRYNTSLFNAETASKLLQDLEAVSSRVADSPLRRLSEVGNYVDELTAARAQELASEGESELRQQLRLTRRRAISIQGAG